MFRTLEECKRTIEPHLEIPKNDRLDLREEIRKHPNELIELFRRHRKNPSTTSIELRKSSGLADRSPKVHHAFKVGAIRRDIPKRQVGDTEE